LRFCLDQAAKHFANGIVADEGFARLVYEMSLRSVQRHHRIEITSVERAVQLDPNFALAWAQLSRADSLLYFVRVDTTEARRDAAKRALDSAQQLQPNSPETQLALGYYQYHVLRDYKLAKATFLRVRKMLPGSSEVLEALASVARRTGNRNESIAY